MTVELRALSRVEEQEQVRVAVASAPEGGSRAEYEPMDATISHTV